MSDISELEGRITAALDRIGQGLDALGPKPDESQKQEIEALKSRLADEETANAQLQERVKAIKSSQDDELAALTATVDTLRVQLEQGSQGVARLRKVSGELRLNNAALREAASEGLVEPHLINKSMMAELEALRAAQAADRAELDAILGALEPMVAAPVSTPVSTPASDGDEPNKESADA